MAEYHCRKCGQEIEPDFFDFAGPGNCLECIHQEVTMRKPILYARTSDNVLDEEDWPVVKLTLEGQTVVATELVNRGCYDLSGMPAIGWSMGEIQTWTHYDPTGHHPENYNEIRPEHDEKWRDFVTAREMRLMLSGEPLDQIR